MKDILCGLAMLGYSMKDSMKDIKGLVMLGYSVKDILSGLAMLRYSVKDICVV